METYGPENSTLLVRTERAGAAAKAGHDLTIEVQRWEATVEDGRVTMTADSRSLKVLEGHGGMKSLDADDMRNIEQTINDEILEGGTIAFTGTIDATGAAEGELDLCGTTRPVRFTVADRTSRAVVKQTDFGIKPYSALFGTLKVADEVTVELQSR